MRMLYQAKDGKLFNTEVEALSYEQYLHFCIWSESNITQQEYDRVDWGLLEYLIDVEVSLRLDWIDRSMVWVEMDVDTQRSHNEFWNNWLAYEYIVKRGDIINEY